MSMLFRKFRIKIMEERLEKKFKKLCIRSRYLAGDTTADILLNLRCSGILLERMLTKGKTIERDYYEVLKHLYTCKTIDEWLMVINEMTREVSMTEQDMVEINEKIELLKQKYTNETSLYSPGGPDYEVKLDINNPSTEIDPNDPSSTGRRDPSSTGHRDPSGDSEIPKG